MNDNRIQIRGNKDGVNVIIDIEKFPTFDAVIEGVICTLEKGKAFYSNSIIKITSNFKNVTDSDIAKLKDEICEKINVRDCVFDDINEFNKSNNSSRIFNGINEGKTKFIKKTVRGGQCIEYPGNIIIIGDVNSGAEIKAGGNKKSIIAAFLMQPELMQISDILTLSPDDGIKPSYPEVAKIKDGYIVVEPYLPNKYIY